MTDLSTMTPYEAYYLARDVREAPWPEAELVIMTDPRWAFYYARDVRKAPWPEAEPIIKNSIFWDDYVKHFNIKEKEMTDLSTMTPYDAYCYARDVRKAPWPEAESVIRGSRWWDSYVKYFNIKEKETNNLIKAIITLNNGTESIIEFPSSLEAEQWRLMLRYNTIFLCIDFEKATYVKTRDIQSITFNKSLIEMTNLAKEESTQRERVINSHLGQMAGGIQPSPTIQF